MCAANRAEPSVALAQPPTPVEHGAGPRIDGELKVTGQILYSDDLMLEELQHVAVLRSPHPHARIRAIDTTAAARVPGVHVVLKGADVAHIRFGREVRDAPILAVDRVRFIGEMVAAVAADSRDAAEEAVALIEVDYAPMPAVFDPIAALQPDAPALHDAPWSYAGAQRGPNEPLNLMGRSTASAGGDVEEALAKADRVFEHTFRTQAHHQGYIEPHSCTVQVGADGRISIWSCNKAPYKLREQLAAAFDVPEELISSHSPAIGGDFGGKGSPMDIPLCVELSRRTQRPVRMTMRYTEELTAGGPRHASETRVRVGVSHDGHLQALDAHAYFNGGAYGGFRPRVKFGATAATSYRIPTIRVIADRAYTNQLPGGNARAPGAPQLTFAIESMLDLVARELGVDPFEFRRLNILLDGDANPFGEHWPETRGLATLEAAEQAWRPTFPADAPSSVRFGTGVAVYDRATHGAERTSIRLKLQPDGSLEAQVPFQETGTGSHTVIRRVLAGGLGVPESTIVFRYLGTPYLPYDSGVGGSRVTVSASAAAHLTVLAFQERLAGHAAGALGVPPQQVEVRPGGTCVDRASGRSLDLPALASAATAAGTGVEAVGESDPHAQPAVHKEHATSFCVQIAQVGVDEETGQVTLYEMVTSVDTAQILDPLTHQAQVEGGVVMGIGAALTEDLGIQDGQVAAAHMGEYKLPSIADMAALRTVLLPPGKGVGPCDIKAIGELTNVPTGAAIANAVADAVGVRIDSLPITAEKVYRALQERRGS